MTTRFFNVAFFDASNLTCLTQGSFNVACMKNSNGITLHELVEVGKKLGITTFKSIELYDQDGAKIPTAGIDDTITLPVGLRQLNVVQRNNM